ncbi:MAG TPA: hypothetical protein VJ939_10095 [Bacteroidales bacterium]|nr:hypothetical protein [Bacteroidales bacterium]HKK76035.1 hypothetical protein [Saprospiraceae bacterium]
MVYKSRLVTSTSQETCIPPAKVEKVLEAELVLGVPSRSCRGNGICRLYTKGTLELERAYCHFAEVRITSNPQEDLSFFFSKASMRLRTLQQHFSGDHFLLEETVKLPEFFCQVLRLQRSEILAGKYTISEDAEWIAVYFPNHYSIIR